MSKVVIIGAGIVGVAAAYELSRAGAQVLTIDRYQGAPRGSTAFAPGFVGVYNDADVMTELARESVETYRAFGASFETSGGLELATTSQGAQLLCERVERAAESGLDARMRTVGELPSAVRSFVDETAITAVAHYADDGVAETSSLRADIQHAARALGTSERRGVDAVAIERNHDSWTVITSDSERHAADHVILAGGVWGPELAGMMGLRVPLFPVAHPYVYAHPGRPPVAPGPFVRWPERHVYARAHADTLGIGSYDHIPVQVSQEQLAGGAGLPWDERFDGPMESAQRLLRPQARFSSARRINGAFAMTPDNLPFLGAHPHLPGLWIAQAIWVTHAGGAARALAGAITRDESISTQFAVDRFDGREVPLLVDAAMRLYRDIYANDGVGEAV